MKYTVEVKKEHVAKVLDIARFWHVAKATMLDPRPGQYCTRYIEIETSQDIMHDIYSDLKYMEIRNYLREAA